MNGARDSPRRLQTTLRVTKKVRISIVGSSSAVVAESFEIYKFPNDA